MCGVLPELIRAFWIITSTCQNVRKSICTRTHQDSSIRALQHKQLMLSASETIHRLLWTDLSVNWLIELPITWLYGDLSKRKCPSHVYQEMGEKKWKSNINEANIGITSNVLRNISEQKEYRWVCVASQLAVRLKCSSIHYHIVCLAITTTE
jgi:hypothetical protein